MTTVTTKELKQAYAKAWAIAKGHNRTAYGFALKVLKNAESDVVYSVRVNPESNTFNIGDVVECLLKSILQNEKEVSVALGEMNDLDRKTMNEIKAFSNASRTAGELKTPRGFIAVSEYGVHYITKVMCKKYWDTFKKTSKGYAPTKQALIQMLNNENPRLFKGLTQKLGL